MLRGLIVELYPTQYIFQYGAHASQSKDHDMDLTLFSLNVLHAQVEDLVDCITLRAFSSDSGERFLEGIICWLSTAF